MPPPLKVRPLSRTRPPLPQEFKTRELIEGMPPERMTPQDRQMVIDSLENVGLTSISPSSPPQEVADTIGRTYIASRALEREGMLLPGIVPQGGNELTVDVLRSLVENPIRVGSESLDPSVNPGYPFSGGVGVVPGKGPLPHPFYMGPWSEKYGADEAKKAQIVWSVRQDLDDRLRERGIQRSGARGRASPTQTYLAPELDQLADYLAARYEAEPAMRRFSQGTKAVDPSTGYPRPVLHATQAGFQSFQPGSSPGIAEKLGSWHAEDPELASAVGRWQAGGASNVMKPGPGTLDYVKQGVPSDIGFGPIAATVGQDEIKVLRGGSPNFMPSVLQVRNPLVVGSRKELEGALAQVLMSSGENDLATELAKEHRYQQIITTVGNNVLLAELERLGHRGGVDPEALSMMFFGTREFGKKPHTHEQELQIAQQVARVLKGAGYDGIYMADDLGFGPAWVAFDPQQVKSVFNRGGWSIDPDTAKLLPILFPGAAAAIGLQEE